MNPPGREVWTYYVSRDSVNGVLSETCSLWCVKPTRTRHNGRVTWKGAPGFLGLCTLEITVAWFGTYPETDLELIRVEQNASEKRMAEARKQGKR
jgi:hypothetical protein